MGLAGDSEGRTIVGFIQSGQLMTWQVNHLHVGRTRTALTGVRRKQT